MPIPRPKILTAVTIPTGGWVMKFYISDPGGSEFDTAVTFTMAAGTYYVAGDHQSDCFLFEFMTKARAAFVAASHHNNSFFTVDIHPTSHKVRINATSDDFQGTLGNDIKLAWTENDGDDIGKVLGFDHSADDTSTITDNATFTADWAHGYGWYADEDGLLEDLRTEDESDIITLQSKALSGVVKSQRVSSSLYSNRLMLNWVPRSYMYSRGVGYGETNVQPYERNRGLECWWLQARGGVQFRVYREGAHVADGPDVSVTRAVETGTYTSVTSTTLTDTAKNLDTDPQTHKGRIVRLAGGNEWANIGLSFYVSSHTATVYTFPNAQPGWTNYSGTRYFVYDHVYQTYVVDFEKMKKFAPAEIPKIDRYSIEVPMLRYIAP